MKKFSIKFSALGQLLLKVAYPVILMGVAFWAASDLDIRLTYSVFLVLTVLSAWALYAVIQFIRWLIFTIGISDDEIRVGGVHKSWSEIDSGDIYLSNDLEAAIILKTADDKILKIPGA